MLLAGTVLLRHTWRVTLRNPLLTHHDTHETVAFTATCAVYTHTTRRPQKHTKHLPRRAGAGTQVETLYKRTRHATTRLVQRQQRHASHSTARDTTTTDTCRHTQPHAQAMRLGVQHMPATTAQGHDAHATTNTTLFTRYTAHAQQGTKKAQKGRHLRTGGTVHAIYVYVYAVYTV